MSNDLFSSDFIRDEPWVAEYVLSDNDPEPAASLYRSCLGRPFPADAVCKVGTAEILVTGEFSVILKQIEAVWARQEDLDKPQMAVDIIGESRTGMTTFLRYMLIREACRSQPVVLFAFDHWFIFTPSGTVFRFDDKKRIPNFGNKLFNTGIVCLVDAVGSQGRSLAWIFVQANMRYVQVVTDEYARHFSCGGTCIATRLYLEGPTQDEKNEIEDMQTRLSHCQLADCSDSHRVALFSPNSPEGSPQSLQVRMPDMPPLFPDLAKFPVFYSELLPATSVH